MSWNDRDCRVGILCGLAAALIWGAWPVVSRLGVEAALSPYDVAALRFGVAGLILLPLLLRRAPRALDGLGWPRALLLACGAGVPYVAVTVEGLRYAPAGISPALRAASWRRPSSRILTGGSLMSQMRPIQLHTLRM